MGLFFSTCFTLLGQSTDVKVKQFDVEDGLSESNINCMIQDSRGYIWIGTNDGLNRFDGHSFYVFRNKISDSASICDNLIRSICEDKKGNVWIATSNGLSMFDRSKGAFLNFYHNAQDMHSISDNSVFCVFSDNENRLWIKTSDILDLYSPKTKIFKHYKPFNNVFNRLSPISRNIIFEDVFQNIWIGTKDGLNCFEPRKEQFQLFTHDDMDPMSLSNTSVRTLYEDRKGSLWIGTDNGLNEYLRRAKSFRHFAQQPIKEEKANHKIINSICQDRHNNMWIGTSEGLYQLNTTTGEYKTSAELFSQDFMKRIFSVNSLLIDNSNLLWIGTSQGLIKIDFKANKLHTFRNNAKDEDSPENYVSCICGDSQDHICVGTWGYGLRLYNEKKQLVQTITSSNQTSRIKLTNDFISSLHLDSRGTLWIGTANGLFIYNEKEQSLKNFLDFNSKISIDYFENNRISAIHESAKGLWVGCDNGLYYIDPKSNQVNCFFQLKNDSIEIKLNSIFSITEDDENNIYLGTDKGLIKFNPLTNAINIYNAREKADKKISSNVVYSVLVDSKKALWVGTNTGLNKYNQAKKSFDLFTDEKGMPNNQVYSLEEDNHGNIWLSTNHGLACLNTMTNQFLSFDLSDGLQGYKFNIGSSYKTIDGQLYFGGTYGFNYFYPDSIGYNPSIPNVVINVIEFSSKGKTGLIHSDTGSVIHLPYRTHFFNVDFSSLDFTLPEKNNYAYYMAPKGRKSDWIPLGHKHTVSFYNLPSDEYELWVKGTNNDNIWNDRGTHITIIIETPIWKTRTALFFYGILIFLTLYLGYMYRTRTLRRTNRILREKEQASRIVSRQKEELTIKNKNITDSIYYAKRIQDALMPPDKMIKRLLPSSFIYLRPRDIVSGDFYWIAEKEDKVYLAAVDCTGHGVPGAIMSILGFELFRTTFNSIEEDDPAKFLNKLNDEFTRFLSDEQNYNLRDGMDVSPCIFEPKKMRVQFAGAINPLYIIRDNKIIDIRADRFSVSMYKEKEMQQQFKNNIIDLKQDDQIYMLSDGYADQFGGPEGKKYKYRRFRHLLLNIHRLPMEEQRQFLDESMDNWKGELEQVDDILIIGIKADFGQSSPRTTV